MTIIKTRIYAWLPLHKEQNRWFDPELPYSYQDCLQNLLSDLGRTINTLSNNRINAKVSISDPSPSIKQIIKNLNSAPFFLEIDYTYIKIECDCLTNWEELVDLNKDHPVHKSNIPGFTACSVSSILTDCLLMIEIAYPSRFNFVKGITTYRQKAFNYIDNVSGFYRETLFSNDGMWPTIVYIPLIDVSEWINDIKLFESYSATTPIQRGLASLTQIIGEEHASEETSLFWAMQGLEAIYCRGKSELRGQLTEKIQLFIGEWPEPKNIIGKLYDLRSAFVHGSFNTCRWNNDIIPIGKGEEEDSSDLYKANNLAQRLLLSTIQKCITNKIHSLEFNYTLKIN